jgi:hypothetical protein
MTNTPMISNQAGFNRAELIQPEVMAPPLVWLVSDAAGKVIGRRFLAVHWDAKLPPEEGAEKAGAPVAWTSIATMPITPNRSQPSEGLTLGTIAPVTLGVLEPYNSQEKAIWQRRFDWA